VPRWPPAGKTYDATGGLARRRVEPQRHREHREENNTEKRNRQQRRLFISDLLDGL
jgi:hypothetical protein